MIEREADPDDRTLDALIDSLARVDAPHRLAARVIASLDARADPPGDRAWTRRLAIGALALAVLTLVMWIGSGRHASVPDRSARREAAAAALRTAAEVTPQHASPAATAETPSPVMASRVGRFDAVARKPRALPADHERALAALDPIVSLKPGAIAPAAIDPQPIDVEPISEISPLTIQSGRETSGRGDFK
jgi:hypothetical protein